MEIQKIDGVGQFWNFDQISLIDVERALSGIIYSAEQGEIVGITAQFWLI